MTLPQVQAQYERYPYPPRKPEDEKRMLFPTGMDQLDRLNHYGWGGQCDLASMKVLVAGGGTGDATVYLAEQLTALHPKDKPCIVHLDLSSTSLGIARSRIEARGLRCVKFIQGSLFDIQEICRQNKGPYGEDLDAFDYINCSGVLHHLEDPDLGLKALRSVLKPTGVMGIMLYGQYGRTGVYQMQDLLRRLCRGDETPEQKVELCRQVIDALPSTNWFARQRDQLLDLEMGDAAIYDLLLHPQDRAYTVEQVYEFVQGADLELIDFVHLDGTAKRQYDPSNYWAKEGVLERLAKMPLQKQQAVAELAAGNMLKHSFYCAPKVRRQPSPCPKDWIPDYSQRFDVDGVANKELSAAMRAKMGEQFTITHASGRIMVRVNPRIAEIIGNIDGKRSIQQVVEKSYKTLDPSTSDPELEEVLYRDFERLHEAMGYYDWMFVRAPGLHRAPRMKDLQVNTLKRFGKA